MASVKYSRPITVGCRVGIVQRKLWQINKVYPDIHGESSYRVVDVRRGLNQVAIEVPRHDEPIWMFAENVEVRS